LDNLLDVETRDALIDAVGEKGAQKRGRETRKVLTNVARGADKFMGGLSRVVLVEVGAAPKSALGDNLTQHLVNQVLELQAVALFSGSSAEDLAEVAALLTPRAVPAKTVLFTQGEPPGSIYLVRTGTIELTRDGRVLDRLGPGDACGVLAVLDRLPREVTAEAVSDCSLLVTNGDALVQLLADRPTLMHGIFRALTGSIRNQIERTQLERKAR
ncbi:MAG: cyclic nucleotide-binding domain-containing protein, partial [Clostridia bacterium]|nr:cyclic nucleotide-binding domain-containing protein [Deltaproteobacteria bacterium]